MCRSIVRNYNKDYEKQEVLRYKNQQEKDFSQERLSFYINEEV